MQWLPFAHKICPDPSACSMAFKDQKKFIVTGAEWMRARVADDKTRDHQVMQDFVG